MLVVEYNNEDKIELYIDDNIIGSITVRATGRNKVKLIYDLPKSIKVVKKDIKDDINERIGKLYQRENKLIS